MLRIRSGVLFFILELVIISLPLLQPLDRLAKHWGLFLCFMICPFHALFFLCLFNSFSSCHTARVAVAVQPLILLRIINSCEFPMVLLCRFSICGPGFFRFLKITKPVSLFICRNPRSVFFLLPLLSSLTPLYPVEFFLFFPYSFGFQNVCIPLN